MIRNSALRIGGALLCSALAGCGRTATEDAHGVPPAETRVATADSHATAATGDSSHATDWPVWRGVNGDAVSTETDWTSDWPKDGPKKLWTASVGVGFSAISVANGRAYTLGHDPGEPKKGHDKDRAEDKNETKGQDKLGDDTVWCFDAAKGHVIWKQSYPCKRVANLHEGGPAATPTIDGNHVYTLSKEGHLFCFDAAKGDIVWKVELQKLLDVEMPPWGFSGSPRVFEDKLILDAGPTIALNKNTGEIIWKTKDFVVGYGSPIFFSVGGETLAAVLNNQFLLIVRAKDGSIVDKSPWTSSFATSATTPVVEPTAHGATIFISTGYDTGCALYDLADGKLTQRYKNKNMRNHMATSVAWKNVMFGFDGNSSAGLQVKLVALNRDTGEVFWKQGRAHDDEKIGDGLGCGTLMRAGDKLILLSDSGRLVIAEASEKEFKPLVGADVLKGKCWTMPVLAEGRIYCRNAAGDVVCLNVKR